VSGLRVIGKKASLTLAWVACMILSAILFYSFMGRSFTAIPSYLSAGKIQALSCIPSAKVMSGAAVSRRGDPLIVFRHPSTAHCTDDINDQRAGNDLRAWACQILYFFRLDIGNVNYPATSHTNHMLMRQGIDVKSNGLIGYVQTPNLAHIRHQVQVTVDCPPADVGKYLPSLLKYLLSRHVTAAGG
jgi:hypothetical protein